MLKEFREKLSEEENYITFGVFVENWKRYSKGCLFFLFNANVSFEYDKIVLVFCMTIV